LVCFIALILCGPFFADDDLHAKAQNLAASMISLPLKLTADFGAPNGSDYIFNINPVILATIVDWNLINRALIQK
jgi:hypothetical protein